MENEKLTFLASAISVRQQSMAKNDVFLVVKFRAMDTLPNRNKQGVTPKFLSDMISRRDQLLGLPLYCDTSRLLNHDYEQLGHMLDQNGVFHSTQIGSMIDFELENEGGVTAMIATARIPKRQFAICECIQQLYEMDALKFSFEISYNPDHTVEMDGVTYVDSAPDNVWTGVAVVSVPACVNSCALQMVAEKNAEANEGVENAMKEEQVNAMIAEAVKAKEEEMAKVIAEKDAVIAERDATIAALQTVAEDNEKPEEKEEEAVAAAEDPENKDEACAAADDSEKKDEACAETEDPEKKDEAVAESDEKKELPWEKEEDATAEAKSDEKDNACAEAGPGACEMKMMQDEINRMRIEIASLSAAKAELESIRAEMAAKEMEANQAMAKAFAEKQGLDSADEAVSKAIAELDYKMIAELSMKIEQPAETQQVVASFAGNGFEIVGKWDDMLAPRK